jgi:hypothetical protein
MVRLSPLASAALAALLALPPAAHAATRSWASGDGWFFDPARWHQNLPPGSDDDIFIGNFAAAAGATVTMGGNWGIYYGSLNLTNGVTLDTNGSELVSFGTATLSGNGTRLIARPAPFLNQRDFQGRVLIGAGAHVELRDNVGVNFFENSVNDGTISGRGTVVTGTGFVNNGVIRPGNNGGLQLRFGEFAGGSGDLDGSTGNGLVDLTSPFSQLQVQGARLQDSFNGRISMVPGAALGMQLDEGWTLDGWGRITVLGFNNVAESQIGGSHLTFHGELDVDLAEGKLRMLAPMTVMPAARIAVGHSDVLRLDGSTQVQGGSFTLGRFGTMEFNGATTLSGGSFATHSTSWNDGSIAFNGATTWNGVVTLTGTARQQGTATVSGGFAGATIHADRFDMDGLSGNTVWNVNAPLTVVADQIATTPANRFEGTLNIGGGFAPRLTMNLRDPNAGWIMAGTLRLSGLTALVETKLAGSRMEVQGRVEVLSGRVRVDADTHFSSAGFAGPAVLSFGDADASLQLGGRTDIDAGVQFEGSGALVNAGGGRMWLAHGADLGGVALRNAGALHIAEGAGAATVPSFTQLASGIWTVELGGHAPGTEHDLLTVFGGGATQLDGLLRVALIDLGSGTFRPEVGDEFTILLAPGGVSGSFLNSPVSVADGSVYTWTVLYRPDEVRLQLASIGVVPEPGTWAMWLAGLGLAGSLARRRRSGR